MLMDLFLQQRRTIYDRGDKLHFNERQIPLILNYSPSPPHPPTPALSSALGHSEWKLRCQVAVPQEAGCRPLVQGGLGGVPHFHLTGSLSHMALFWGTCLWI